MAEACTWCSKPGCTVSNKDAAGEKHHWHKRCWHAMLAWLRGHNPPEVLGKAWDDPRGPAAYRGLRRV